jgi:hypothetical protein
MLVGLLGGASLALVAGANRTQSVYDRFLARHPAADALVLDAADFVTRAVDLERVAALPEVEQSVQVALPPFVGRTGGGREISGFDLQPVLPSGEGLGRSIESWKLLEGRTPDPTRVDEAVVDFERARELDLQVGDEVSLRFFRTEGFLTELTAFVDRLPGRVSGRDHAPGVDFEGLAGPEQTVRIVGIVATASGFPPVAARLRSFLFLTPAFADRQDDDLVTAFGLFIGLAPGVDLAQFKTTVEELAGGAPVWFGLSESDHAENVQRSLDLQAATLRVLALVVATAGLLVVSQVLARQASLDSVDHAVLSSLGMTRRQLWVTGMVRMGTIAAIGTAIALGVAGLLSPLWPVGLARTAETEPGIALDAWVLVLGGAATFLLVASLGAVAVRRVVRGGGEEQPSGRTLRRLLAGLPLRVPMRLGVGFALEPGRGRTAVPVRTTILTGALAVGAVAMTLTFSSSLGRLLDTPRLYGWSWDLQIGNQGFPDISTALSEGLAAHPEVRRFSLGTITELGVEGRRVDAYALDHQAGGVRPVLLDGRRPDRADEISLGALTMRALGVELGDRVEVTVADGRRPMTVVGRAVFPDIGDSGQFGEGAQITFGALTELAPDASRNVVLVDFVDGGHGEMTAELRRALDPFPVFTAERPDDLVSFERAAILPTALSAVLVAAVAATLVQTLVTSVRRRGRDLATVRTFGLVRRQVVGVVAWQATTFAATAALIGVPVGIAIGQVAWRAFADHLGVGARPEIDPGIVLLVPAVVLAANLVALVPALRAGRARAAEALRAE